MNKSKSDIVPITLKKDGSFAASGNSTLTGDSLQMLRRYTNQMIEDSATRITQGQLNINPTNYGKNTACDYCQYRGICQFDPDFLGNQSRILPKMKPDFAMEAMKCKLEEGGEVDE